MSAQSSAADAYLASTVENAPPIKIVRMLYQGAIRFLTQAQGEDPDVPSSRFIELCSNADAIVTELRMSLDPDQADAAVVDNLQQLYMFCERGIQTAMVERTVEPIESVKKVLVTLLEAWQHVEVQENGQRAA